MKRSSFAIVFMLTTMLFLTFSSCRRRLQPQLLLNSDGLYDHLSFSQNGQRLVFGFSLRGELTYIQNIEDPTNKIKISLPFEKGEATGILYDLCLADDIWVTTLYGQIASYNIDAGKWVIHPRISDTMALTFCSTLSENKVIIYSLNRIAIYQNGWKSFELPYKGVITGVAHDSHNQIFAVGMRGNLFVNKEDSWQELPINLEDVELCLHCFGISTDNRIWFADLRGSVFSWDPLANMPPIKISLDIMEQEFITNLFIGPQGQIWIFATDGTWLIDNYQVQRVAIPEGNPLNPYVEPTKERMYFDFGGIGYYNLDDLLGK